MKFNNHFYSILFCVILSVAITGCHNKNADEEVLEIGNELYSKQFTFRSKKPGAISISYLDKKNELAAITNSENPYFEFVLNNKLTSSSNELWQFHAHDTRLMGNGGEEHQLVFYGEKGHVD